MAATAHEIRLLDEWMGLALDEARAALDHDDVPVGAVVIRGGTVVDGRRSHKLLRTPGRFGGLRRRLAAARLALGLVNRHMLADHERLCR